MFRMGAVESNDDSAEMENRVFVNQVILINLLFFSLNRRLFTFIESPSYHRVERQNSLQRCFALEPFIALPTVKPKYLISFSKSHNALFPHCYLLAHCFGFRHVTVTAVLAGKTSSMTAAVFYPDRIQHRKGFIQEKRKRM